MSKMYYVEPGFVEPTVIYEIQLVKIHELHGATVNDVNEELDKLGATKVVIDNANPHFIDRIKTRRFVHKLMRRRPPEQL